MYALECTIKCPSHEKERLADALRGLGVTTMEATEVPYGTFMRESRKYWDYVFPEMETDERPVTYLCFSFPDTEEGRKQCHHVEWSMGWIPLNIRYPYDVPRPEPAPPSASQKERNARVARLAASSAFWRSEIFCRHFSADFTMDIPTAPPGMPAHYTTWEAERCFEWLNRRVRSWNSSIERFYTTPDPNLFWVQGTQKGSTFFGEHDGSLKTPFFMKIEFRDGRISHISWRFHAWAWLEAAGKRVHGHQVSLPVRPDGTTDEFDRDFLIDLNDPDIKAYLDHPVYGSIPDATPEELDLSPEAIAERRAINIGQFACGYYRELCRSKETLSPAYQKVAWFTGMPDRKDLPMDNPLFFAWNKVCSPWMYRDPRSRFYPTDDPHTVFVEMNAHGPGC